MSHTSLSVQVPSHVSSLQSALKFYLEHASSHRHPPFSSKTRSMELCRVPVSLVLQNCSQHKLKVRIVSVCVHVHIGNVRSYGGKLWGRNFHQFRSLRATYECFLHEMWEYHTHLYDWYCIPQSFLHEMLTSYWSAKVFSFESFPQELHGGYSLQL